ncbi:MAG: PAS-domain containing protein [Rhodospirillum sp.]|nr:PAS-domain containing protein [Rhodospirillum sp.]
MATESTPSPPPGTGSHPEGAPAASRAPSTPLPIHDIFEAMDQGVLVADANARVIQWNRRALDLLDVPESLLATHPPHAEVMAYMIDRGAILPEDVDRVRERINHWMKLPEALRPALVYNRHRPDGMTLEVRTVSLPQGGYLRTFTDITEAKRAEERLAAQTHQMDVTLDTVAQGIILIDRNHRVVLHNRRYLELLDIPAFLFRNRVPVISDILAYQYGRGDFGANFELMPEDLRPQMLQNAPFILGTYERVHPDGRTLSIETFALPDGGHVRTFTDITEAKQAESALRAAKEAAEDALEQLTATQKTLLVAEKMASLGQLVAGVAHEINTPIGTSLTAASLLAEKTRALDNALASNTLKRSTLSDYVHTAGECSRFILSNLTRAAELIQSFKQVSVDQTSDERRRFDLRAYLEEILISLHPRLKRGHHDLILDCPKGIKMDSYPGALFRVITNLVVNALTHGFGEDPDLSAGTMTLTARTDGPDHIILTFSDTGRGIAAEHLTRVFDPFFTTRRGDGGTGLGLNIVYNLITQTLMGQITVQSTPGMGTTFSLNLPRSPAPDLRP